MQEKTVRWLVLILLTLLNLGLLFYYVQDRREKGTITQRDAQRIREIYEEEGFRFETSIPLRNQRFEAMNLKPVDLDSLIVNYLGEKVFDRTYIFGAKVQYNTEDIILTADWQTHSITYEKTKVAEAFEKDKDQILQQPLSEEEQLMLEQVGRSFAANWGGEELHLSKETLEGQVLTLRFHPIRDGIIEYFNIINVVVIQEGVMRADMTLWELDSYGEELVTIPIDELLFEELILMTGNKGGSMASSMNEAVEEPMEGPIEDSMKEVLDTVVDIREGYAMLQESEDKAVAVPVVTIFLESGKQYTVRRTG